MKRSLEDEDDRTVARSAARRGDPDRTVGRSTAPRGSDAGPSSQSSIWGHTLPSGAYIGEFEVTGVIGEGGFGIVYLAYDHSLQRSVALKEYMPSSLATRLADGLSVAVKSARHADAFEAGLRSFVNEARLLAKFDHPSLVKVHRFWEQHGTAYMVMPYYEGATLKTALAQRAGPPDERTLRDWLRPLLDALSVMHAADCFHRDIAPDNILLTKGGPLLLDFGAARRVIAGMTDTVTVVLKPGYAPIEQYGEVPTLSQGPWTDLYALASVVHYAIVGKPPAPAVERVVADRMEPLSRAVAGRYSDGFLRAIDAALAVMPQQRPQDIAQFRALLDAPPVPARVASATAVPPGTAAAAPESATRDALVGVGVAIAVGALLAAMALAAWWWIAADFEREPPAAAVAAPPAIAPPAIAPPAIEPPAVAAPATAAPLVAAPAVAPPVAAPAPVGDATAIADPPSPAPPQPPAASPTAESAAPMLPPPVKAAAPQAAVRARPPAAQADLPARCTELLQKASLEPLDADETAFIRKECRR